MFLAVLLALLLAIPAGTALWSHRNTRAYYENRTLATAPVLTWESLWDGTFGADLESWYSDHLPGRATLLKWDTELGMNVLQRPVVNDTVLGDGVLLPFMKYSESPADNAGYAEEIAEKYRKLNEHIEANGGTYYFFGFPEQRVAFQEAYPKELASHAEGYTIADTAFLNGLRERGIRVVDMGEQYRSMGEITGFYSVVDHHYNYDGAYAAYRTVLQTLAADGWELPVLTEDDLDFVEVPNPYIGSRNRTLYNLWTHTERAVIGVQKNPLSFTRTDNGQHSEKPLFVLPASEELPTTYNLYMGGDFGETILETNRPDLPDVLIYGDSFTNPIETLIYTAFDETRVLDLRHYKEKSFKDYITDYQPDLVLCILNDTFYYTKTGNGAIWED